MNVPAAQLIVCLLLQIVAGWKAFDLFLPLGSTTGGADITADRRAEPIALPFSTRQTFRHGCLP